jgi:hypothetical protein
MRCSTTGSAQYGPAQVDRVVMHIGTVTFIHRFDCALNEQVHVHVCMANGVFLVAADDEEIKPKNCN